VSPGWRIRCGTLLLLAGLVPARITRAQGQPVVIAILPFEDRGSYGQEKEVFQALRLGIPATIAAELSGHSELRLANPDRVSRVLQAQKLGPNERIDAATAARIGKEAGARYAITGTFADFYGKFRLEARIVDTESGQILKVVTNNDPQLQDRAQLYRIVQTVGHKVLAEANPAAGRSPPADSGSQAIPTEALTHYSLGLLYERQGDRSKAAQQYNQALSTFPNYPEAREGARRVGGP
jgi:TolB-like protein